MTNTIHIVFATDEGYLKQTLVALVSITHNTTSPIHVHLLDAGLSRDGLARMRAASLRLGFSLDIHKVDREFLGQFPTSEYYRQATYARLRIPNLLRHLDKALYLDPDIVVRDDISKLWNLDVSEFAAAVNMDMDVDFLDPIKKRLGLGKQHTYFNAGVMLLNLDRLRTMGLEEQAVAFAKDFPKRIRVVDQDILNWVLRDVVTRFPLRWNYSPLYHPRKSGEAPGWHNFNTTYSESDQAEADQNPGILHFHNQIKPWHCTPVARSHPWYGEYFRYVDLYHNTIGDIVEPQSSPRLSVIMPCFNVQAFVNQAMDSVIGQRFREISVIAVDDGSTDLTRAILEDYARWDRRISVIHKANGGLGAAYNRGLASAATEYVAFVEPDDWVDCESFERLISQADLTGCDIVKGDFCIVEGTSIVRYRKFEGDGASAVCRFSDLPSAPYGHLGFWAGVYRKKFLDAHGFRFLELPGAGYVDFAFFWMTHTRANTIGLLNRVVYYYRQHGTASTSAGVLAKNWPHLMRNYETVLDDLTDQRLLDLYREPLLHTLYLAARRVASLVEGDVRAKVLERARPLLSDIRLTSIRSEISDEDKRGIRAMIRGDIELMSNWKEPIKRRLRWISKDPYTAGDVSRLRRSRVVRCVREVLAFGRDCILFVRYIAQLCLNLLRRTYHGWKQRRMEST